MQITAATPQLKSLKKSETAAPGEGAPAEPDDKVSLGKAAAGVVLTWMGRRIPPFYADLKAGKAEQLKALVQPGDVILTADMAYPGWARMEYWTVKADYTHAAYCGDNGNIFEATGEGVNEVTPDHFFDGRLKVAIIRPQYAEKSDIQAATNEIRTHLGKPYDNVFNTGDNSEFYCSELVSQGLKSTPHPIEVPMSRVLGKSAVSVDAFLDIKDKTMVYDDRSNYWTNKLAYWPLAASAAGGAAVGAWAAGTLVGGLGAAGAGLLGAGVGLVGSILVGNKIQVGHYLPSLEELRQGQHQA